MEPGFDIPTLEIISLSRDDVISTSDASGANNNPRNNETPDW